MTKKSPQTKPKTEPTSIFKEGDKAPDFKLQSNENKTVSLSDFKGKNVVLYFYPKDMTSGCTQQACDFRDSSSNFKKSNTVIIGISKDSVESHQKFITKYNLPFILLADPETKVAEKYGVWKEKSMYGRKYMGTERTTFLIDKNQVIRKIYPKVKINGHIQEVLNDSIKL